MSTDALPRYRDFALQVGRVDRRTRRFTVRISATIPGEAQPGADDVARVAYEPARLAAEADGVPGSLRTLGDAQLARVGRALADHLLPGAIRRFFLGSLQVVRHRNERLRLRLLIEDPELAALPWEYLCLPPDEVGAQGFLALLPEVSVVRHAALDLLDLSPPRDGGYRLVAASGPAQSLGARSLQPGIGAAIAQPGAIGIIAPTWVADATRDALFEALRGGADIFHFAGGGAARGRDGRIVLARRGRRAAQDLYGGRQLADALRLAATRLAVLDLGGSGADGGAACGALASALLEAGVGAVVASRPPLPPECADILAREVYGGVLAGDRLDEAVTRARLAIAQRDGPERHTWGALTLAMRLGDGVVFPTLAALQAHSGGKLTIVNAAVTIHGNVEAGATVAGVQAASIGGVATTRSVQTPEAGRLAPVVRPLVAAAPLVGRETALRTMEEQLRAGRRLYVYGAYGVGKTSLAAALFTRVEDTFADGRLWYRVANMPPEAVLERVADGLADRQVAQAATLAQKQGALQQLLARRPNLLIALDEVGDRAVAQALLEAAGDCTVILNGDRPLRLSGALPESQLQPLGDDEAVALFVALARPGQLASTLAAEERALVRQICERLGNLPLAIKLAAAKHAEEGESLDLLWQRVRDAIETVGGADPEVASIFAIHYAALKAAPDALGLLVRIAGFPSLEAPLRALQPGLGGRLFAAKDALVARGLAQPVGADRLALHPLLGTAIQNVERDAVAQACDQADAWLREFAHTNRADYDALAREHENLIGLLDRDAARERWDDVVGLLRDTFEYLRVRGQWDAALRRLEGALQAAATLTSTWNRGWAYLHRGILHTLRAEYPAAAADFDRADALFAEVGDQAYRGKVLYRRATLAIVGGDLATARGQLEQAIAWMAEQAPAHDRAAAHERLASLLATQGDLAGARAHYDRALALADPEEQARVEIALGALARQGGDYPAAERHYARAMELAGQIGHVLYRATTEQELGYLHYYQGRLDLAQQHFGAAQALYRQLDYQPGLAQALHALGNVALARFTQAEQGAGEAAGAGALAEAEQAYQAALAINQARGIVINIAYNQYQLAVVARKQGDLALAERRAADALQGAERSTDVALQAAALLQLASLALNRGDHAAAAERFLRSAELAAQAGDRLTAATSQYYQGVLQAQEGNLEAARATLADAHAAFAALSSVDASAVERLLADLSRSPELLAPTPSPPPVLTTAPAARPAGDDLAQLRVLEGGRVLGALLSGLLGGAVSWPKIDRIVEGGKVARAGFADDEE